MFLKIWVVQGGGSRVSASLKEEVQSQTVQLYGGHGENKQFTRGAQISETGQLLIQV